MNYGLNSKYIILLQYNDVVLIFRFGLRDFIEGQIDSQASVVDVLV
jgi:hypothetical protein